MWVIGIGLAVPIPTAPAELILIFSAKAPAAPREAKARSVVKAAVLIAAILAEFTCDPADVSPAPK